MIKHLIVLVLFFVPFSIFGQKLDSIVALPISIIESSGLLFLNGKLYTHTDSGGEAALYEIDTNTALINKTLYIQNAVNIDWEDITQDNDYIYIADFGNNQGNRTNLAILKLDKIDFFNASDMDSIESEKIDFFYEDQTNFNSANQNTAFDAEALIAFEDSLYIFTKNWINQETSVYALPKTTGNFSAKKINSYNVEGLVTGATIHPSNKKISLCGYTKLGNAFIFEMKNFDSSSFFEAENSRNSISPFGSVQIEGICSVNEKECFVSSEKFFTSSAYLHKWTDSSIIILEDTSITSINTFNDVSNLFPNPSSTLLYINHIFNEASVFDSTGKLLLKQFENPLNIENLEQGVYFLVLKNSKKREKIIQFEKR